MKIEKIVSYGLYGVVGVIIGFFLIVLLLTGLGYMQPNVWEGPPEGHFIKVYSGEETGEELYKKLEERNRGIIGIHAEDAETGEEVNAKIYVERVTGDMPYGFVEKKCLGYRTPAELVFDSGHVKIVVEASGYKTQSKDMLLLSGEGEGLYFGMEPKG